MGVAAHVDREVRVLVGREADEPDTQPHCILEKPWGKARVKLLALDET
jgi:hypothetical protein